MLIQAKHLYHYSLHHCKTRENLTNDKHQLTQNNSSRTTYTEQHTQNNHLLSLQGQKIKWQVELAQQSVRTATRIMFATKPELSKQMQSRNLFSCTKHTRHAMTKKKSKYMHSTLTNLVFLAQKPHCQGQA